MAKDLAKTLLKARDADRQARHAVWATIAKQHGMPDDGSATEALLAAMTKAERRQAHRRLLTVGRRFDKLLDAMDGPETAAAFKALRLAAGLSEADLEGDWQLKPHTIRRWESGQRKRIRKWEFRALLGTWGEHEKGHEHAR